MKIGRANIENFKEKLLSRGKTTIGNRVNLICPHCGNNNPHIIDNSGIYSLLIQNAVNRKREAIYFEKKCGFCLKLMFCGAELEINITAKAVE